MKMWVSRPSEPEKSDGKQNTPERHGGESGFGNWDSTCCIDDAGVARLIAEIYYDGKTDTYEKAEERKRRDNRRPATVFGEDYGENFEGEVEERVNEGGVKGYACDHRFCGEH